MNAADFRVALKRKWPLLAWVYSTLRFLREITRTVRMISRLESVGRTAQVGNGDRVVIFNLVRTYVPIQLVIEAALALKLKARGYDVHILYDDGVLYHHETLTRNDPAPFQPYYRLRRAWSLRLLRTVPTLRDMMEPYSRYLRRSDLPELNEPIGSDGRVCAHFELEPFVRASLVRFFLSAPDSRLLESEPDYQRARTMFVRNAIVSLAVAQRVHDRLKPTLLVTSHGIYSSLGTFMKFMMSRGVRSITYGLNGYTSNSLDLAVDDIAANKSDGGYLKYLADEVVDVTLSRLELSERVTSFMDQRLRGGSDDIARLAADHGSQRAEVLTRLDEQRAAGRDIFALFPNVMWDNATTFEEWNRLFESPVQWLVETVRYFAESAEKVLVIRVHPAERSWMPPRKSVRDILDVYLDRQTLARDNIIIIAPQEALSSYSLFAYLRGGIVYNGTIGLELIFAHIALIVGARAAYSEHGFTAELCSRDEYFAAFDDTERILKHQEDHLDQALLFAYEYFFLHGVPMKFMSRRRQAGPDYAGRPEEMWRDANLEHVVRVITGEREFFQDHWRQNAK